MNDVAWLPRHERWRHGRETDGPLRQIHPSSSCQCFHSLKVLKASQCELSSNALPSSSRSLSPRSNLGPPSVLCLNILSILFTSAFLSLSSLFRHAHQPALRSASCRTAICCVQYSHLFMSHWPPRTHCSTLPLCTCATAHFFSLEANVTELAFAAS